MGFGPACPARAGATHLPAIWGQPADRLQVSTTFLHAGPQGLLDQRRGPKGKNVGRWAHYPKWLFAERRRTWGARKLLWGLRQEQPHGRLRSNEVWTIDWKGWNRTAAPPSALP